jgi:hypothetical protein
MSCVSRMTLGLLLNDRGFRHCLEPPDASKLIRYGKSRRADAMMSRKLDHCFPGERYDAHSPHYLETIASDRRGTGCRRPLTAHRQARHHAATLHRTLARNARLACHTRVSLCASLEHHQGDKPATMARAAIGMRVSPRPVSGDGIVASQSSILEEGSGEKAHCRGPILSQVNICSCRHKYAANGV